LLVTLLIGFVATAFASGPAGGTQVSNSAIPNGTAGVNYTANTPFASGQNITVTVPANSVLTPETNIKIEECSDPGGLPANDPSDNSECDGNTLDAVTILDNSNGSVSYDAYTVYSLPNLATLGESSSAGAVCDLSHACVLYIGEDQTDFTQPHFFSQPFYVAPVTGDTGEPAGDGSAPPVAAAPSPTLSTVTTSATSAVGDGTDLVNISVTLLASGPVPVTGKTVALTPVITGSSSAGSSVIKPTSTGSNVTNSSGEADFTVTDPTAESITYTAKDTTDSITLAATVAVTFTTPTVSVGNSKVVASPTKVVAPATSSQITVTLYDQAADPAPVNGKTVTLSASSTTATVTPSSAVSGANGAAPGTAVFTVTDTNNEDVTFTAFDQTDGLTITARPVVTFGTLTPSPATSTVVAAGTVASAGSATVIAPTGNFGTTVTVTVLTSGKSAVSGETVALTSPSTTATVTPSSAVTGANGVAAGTAVFTVTDTAAETVTFSASDTTISSSPVPFTQTAAVDFEVPALSPTASTVEGPSGTEPADGSTPAPVSIALSDQFGDPIKGATVTAVLTDASGNAHATPVTGDVSDAAGVVAFNVVDTAAEKVTFAATATTSSTSSSIVRIAKIAPRDSTTTTTAVTTTTTSSTTSTTTTTTVASTTTTTSAGGATGSTVTIKEAVVLTFTPGLPDPTQSTLGASPTQVPSDGKTASTVTVTLNDHFGNPVPGKTVGVQASAGGSTGSSVITPLSPTTNASGQATFSVTDATAEVVTYTAVDTTDNIKITGQGVAVTFGNPPPPPPVIADSTITASATTAPADGTTTVTIAVILNDANGDPVSGKVVALNTSGGTSVVTTVTGTTNSDGEATYTVVDKTAETVTYTATDTTDTLPLTGLSAQVVFTPATTTSTSTSGSTDTSESGAVSTATDTGSGSGDSSSLPDTASSASSSGGSGGTLAYTGVPSLLPWLATIGLLLFIGGSIGRRSSLRVL
jgi:predicted aconitase with swiveling domain